jgi:uncharacterized oxidoreductase
VPKVNHQQLLKFCNELLSSGGMPPIDAPIIAELLVKAELSGYPGHGVTRVVPYLNWLKDGTCQVRERPSIERQGQITAVIDGKHYPGQVAARMAMELAVNKAKQHGAGIVTVRRAGHTGRLADYMEMATEAGLIGMGAVCTGSSVTTLYGGMEPITGTNPIAFGIPARNGRAIILDLATASMSMGEIQQRVARKEAIPEGVMLDGHGNPTTDFKTFRGPPRGVFLPFGGHKGSGVALVTELLGGILSGNGPGRDWWERGGHGVNGVFLQAFAVEEFQALDTFYDKVDEFIAYVKSTKPAPGFDEIYLPGEKARKTEAKRLRDGVEIDVSTWKALTELAAELRIRVPNAL